MATSLKSAGDVVDYTAGATISSGDVVVMGVANATDGSTVGIALTDIANGSIGAVAITGVFTMTKVSTAVIAQGSVVNWDSSVPAVEDHRPYIWTYVQAAIVRSVRVGLHWMDGVQLRAVG